MTTDLITQLGGRERLESSLQLNTEWILKSFAVHENKGSASYRTTFGRWASLYPETTGYLLRSKLGDNFSKMATDDVIPYLLSLQNKDGSFKDPETGKALNVFDTSQIILGLLHRSSQTEKAVSSINHTYQWMLSHLLPSGKFSTYNYVQDYNPSYYARIAWTLLAYEKAVDIKHTQSLTLLDYILSLQNDNLSFRDWGLSPDSHGLTHTIAYTLRGLYESARILDDENLTSLCTDTLLLLSKHITKNKKAAASYDQNWKGDHSYICSVGNAQLAYLYLRVAQDSNNPQYLEPVFFLLKPLVQAQRTWLFNKGAIPASIPIWGKYHRFRYTNWTQKFYNDAIHLLLNFR